VFSTYGPKDAPYWVIPRTIRQIKNGRRVALTAGEQCWGFLFVRDAAAAFRLALEEDRAEGVYNVGAVDAPPLRNTIKQISTLLGLTGEELGFGEVPYRPDQVMMLQADIRRLQELGWAPRVSLSAGLKETVAWYASED
jgi:UDP-glucose 4-epimerase